MMISERLKHAIRNAGRPQWQIARAVGMHPVTLSNLMTGSRDAGLGDPRIIALGRLVDVSPDECFAATASDAGAAL